MTGWGWGQEQYGTSSVLLLSKMDRCVRQIARYVYVKAFQVLRGIQVQLQAGAANIASWI